MTWALFIWEQRYSRTSETDKSEVPRFSLPKTNKPMNEKIHIGELIRHKLKENQRSITWLANKIGYARSTLCKALKNNHIHSELLLRISHALEHDFFAHYSVLLYDKKEDS